MSKASRMFIGSAVAAASLAQMATITSAAPLPMASPATVAPAQAALVEQVQWRRGWRGHGGRGVGWGIGAGILGGAIIGSALASPYYYERPYYYYPRTTYYYEPGGDAVGYCMRRFRSYDPRTGTYLGYDGYRHPCP